MNYKEDTLIESKVPFVEPLVAGYSLTRLLITYHKLNVRPEGRLQDIN